MAKPSPSCCIMAMRIPHSWVNMETPKENASTASQPIRGIQTKRADATPTTRANTNEIRKK